MYKKELERKQREEQEATAHAFQEFIKTFQDVSGPPNKLFVRSGILNGSSCKEDEIGKGKIYNPSVTIKPNSNTLKNAIECARLLKDNKIERTKINEKPKSNLELLKEELRLRHLERSDKYKTEEVPVNFTFFNTSDQNTTNLFVANINPKITEQDLIKIFGVYGPLASVKIMWPKNDDKARTNCGFVAYMSRKDGERALQELKNYDDMRIGWGKPVELPAHPIYIPPELLKLLLPPPYSGLPFNAQPPKQPFDYPKTDKEMKELLYNSIVKVTIPLDKKLLMLIHRSIEFVVVEGPMFEAIIMNREINNPAFQFLFDNKSASHVYYRWKLYSILKGESLTNWSQEKFRMFEGGSIWIPPILPDYTRGMPDNLVKEQEKINSLLSVAQRNRLIQYIQNLTPVKSKIGEAMVFCLNHNEASQEISNLITDSLKNASTAPIKKLARLYLISDVLRNCMKKRNDNYQNNFTPYLETIFEKLKSTCDNLILTTDQNMFKTKILKVLKAWDLWRVFPHELLTKLESILNGDGDESSADEPLDGKSLMKRLNGEINSDVNVPSKNAIATKQRLNEPLPGFIPSKWETIDPEQVEAEAMSTKKFHDIEIENQMKEQQNKPKTDRVKLRQVEVEVMKYQDELEAGGRKLKKNFTIEEQVNDYRDYLLTKVRKDAELSSNNSDDSSPERKKKKYNRKKRNKYKSN